jgi:hypothetical protein
MTEECWSLGRERSGRNGAHDAGTEEAHDGEGTSISEGREDQEVSDAGRLLRIDWVLQEICCPYAASGRAAHPPGRVHPGR